jgi:hypothetical protein
VDKAPKGTTPLIVEVWSPFEVFLMGACVLSGAGGLVPHAPRGVIDELAPSWALVWYLGLIVGGVLCLVAVTLKFPISTLLERVAVLMLAGLAIAYGVGIFLLQGLDGTRLLGGLVTLAFGFACAGRAWQIGHRLSRLQHLADTARDGGGG